MVLVTLRNGILEVTNNATKVPKTTTRMMLNTESVTVNERASRNEVFPVKISTKFCSPIKVNLRETPFQSVSE